MQDIAQVWMTTAGLVWYDIPICRKHGAKTATQSLYCRDPLYVPNPGTGPGRRPILYSDIRMCKMYTLCVPLHVLDPPLASLTHTMRRRHRNEFKKRFKQTAYMLYLPHYST